MFRGEVYMDKKKIGIAVGCAAVAAVIAICADACLTREA